MGHQMKDFVAVSDSREEVTCPVCGELFKPAEEHSYHIEYNKRKLVCTYTCMRKWEKGEAKRLFAPKPKNRKYGDIRIVETGETFKTIQECATHLKAQYSGVQRALQKGYLCHGYHIEEVKEGEKNA